MTPYASVCLIRRDGGTVFRRPRKERPTDATQARKAAARFWRRASKDDVILRIVLVRERGGVLEIAERASGERDWNEYTSSAADAMRQPHLAACMAALGVTEGTTPPTVPELLVINGRTYRRDM